MQTRLSSILEEAPQYITLVGGKVPAGLPIGLQTFTEDQILLSEFLVRDPGSTFLVRTYGDSMIEAGIFSEDLLIVDHGVEPRHGNIVVAVLNGDLTVKRLHLQEDGIILKPENPQYEPIYVTEELSLLIAGVVIHAIHTL